MTVCLAVRGRTICGIEQGSMATDQPTTLETQIQAPIGALTNALRLTKERRGGWCFRRSTGRSGS
jgi:hypothetical protein